MKEGIEMGEYYGVTVEALCKLMQYSGLDGVIEISKLGGAEEICEKLRTSPTEGLRKAFEHRRATFGSNEIPRKPIRPTVSNVLRNVFCDQTLIILLISYGFAVLFYHYSYYVSKVGCVFVVILVSFLVNYCSERKFQYLFDDVTARREVFLIRNSVQTKIDVDDVVVGDVCLLKDNDIVPADGILIGSNALKVDESSLIGSSGFVNKSVHSNPMVLRGTKIINGNGRMVALAVGMNSRQGILSSLLAQRKGNVKQLPDRSRDCHLISFANEKSILQQKIQRLFKNIIYVCSVIAAIIFFILVIRFVLVIFIIEQHSWKFAYIQKCVHFLFTSCYVLVLGVPETILLTVTVVLGITIVKLYIDNKLVRNMQSAETMGNVTSICFDKTGTLTTNRMDVVEAFINECDHSWVSASKSQIIPSNTLNLLADNISINSSPSSTIIYATDNSVEQIGNKTECALLGFVKEIGLNFESIRENSSARIIHVYPFNSDRKLMATVIQLTDGSYRLFVKGASEMVLSKCKFLIGRNEKLLEMTSTNRNRITLDVIEPKTKNRLRTISLAYRDFVVYKTAVNETVMNGVLDWTDEMNIVQKLTFLGLFAMDDPIRSEVPGLIGKLSGITLRMVTGDDINTATSIATKCGLFDNFHDVALDAAEFNRRIRDTDGNIQQHLFNEVYPTLRVLARATPIDKYNLVNGIIESTSNEYREIVAMVGDGEGDALALKKADVGITFKSSSDTAKNASNIILTDNKIGGIVNSILWGRHSYESIAKFVQFILSVKLVSVALLALVLHFNLKIEIYRADLLWIVFALVPIFFYDPIENFMAERPYGRSGHIISKNMLKNIIGQSLYQILVLIPFYFATTSDLLGFSLNARFILNSFVVISLFNVFNSRSLHGDRNVFHKIQQNVPLCLIWILAFNVTCLTDQFAFPREAMDLSQWLICLLLGIGILVWQQLLFCCNTTKQIKKITPVMV